MGAHAVSRVEGGRTLGPRVPGPPLGWPLLPLPEDGRLAYPDLATSVRQSIKIILLTQPGELLLHSSFGAGLEAFLHEPNVLVTRRRMRDQIAQAIQRWEPRIYLDQVEVREVADRPDTVRVEIVYRLKRSGETAQLVLDVTLGA